MGRRRSPSVLTVSMPIAAPDRPYKVVALDIGGTLCKVVWHQESGTGDGHGHLNLVKFPSSEIALVVQFLKSNKIVCSGSNTRVHATGGGACKHGAYLEKELGVPVVHMDEIQCLVEGSYYALSNFPEESFTFEDGKKVVCPEEEEVEFPYMITIIGSGVSVVRVDSPTSCVRVTGTCIGGGTFFGLMRLLYPDAAYDDILDDCAAGDNTKVDMLVGDIYGRDYSGVGLQSEIIASSFGKLGHHRITTPSASPVPDPRGDAPPALDLADSSSGSVRGASPDSTPSAAHMGHSTSLDGAVLAREIAALPDSLPPPVQRGDIGSSLLTMISVNVAQIAYLAAAPHNCKRMYFAGHFIRHLPLTMDRISFGIGYYSGGNLKPRFLVHEGFLGTFGAFVATHQVSPSPSPVSSPKFKAQRYSGEAK